MDRKKGFIGVVCVLLITANYLLAQPLRNPVSYFKPIDYKGGLHNYTFVQDRRGIIYVGNEEMVLEYDGVRWKSIPIKPGKGVNVYALATDTLNRIFVGGNKEFGFLKPNEVGKLEYQSLYDSLPPGKEGFGSIIKIHTTASGVFFVAPTKVFYWNGRNFSFYTPQGLIKETFFIENKLFAYIEDIGLTIFDSGKFIPLPYGEELAKQGFVGMIKYRKRDQYLAYTRNKGFVLLNSLTTTINLSADEHADKFISIKTPYDQILLNNDPIGMTMLDNDRFAVYTHLGGIFIFDKDFNLKSVLNRSKGLKFNRVKTIFADRENFLWVGLENGINRVDYKSQYSVYNESSGIEGSVMCVTRHNGQLCVGTTNGAFIECKFTSALEAETENKVFLNFENFSSLVHKFMRIDNDLYAVASDGIFKLNEDRSVTKILNGTFNNFLLVEETKDLFLSGDKGIFIYEYQKTPTGLIFTLKNQFNHLPNDITNWLRVDGLSNENYTVIYVSTLRNGVYKIKINENDGTTQDYSLSKYNSKELEQTFLIGLKGNYYVGSACGVLEITKDFTLKETKIFGQELTPTSKRKVLKLFKIKSGDIWVQTTHDDRFELGLCNYNGASYSAYDKSIFRGVDLGIINDIYQDESNLETLWFAGFEGLESYHENLFSLILSDPKTIVRSVFVNYDSLIFGGIHRNKLGWATLKQDPSTSIILPGDYNNVSFEFCAPNTHNQENVLYSYFLEGYSNNWSVWGNSLRIDFTNLSKGKYTFKVRAMSISGNPGKSDSYTFFVLAPWYLTNWAFAAYTLLFVGIIYLIFRISLSRLNAARQRLEKLVKERTYEVLVKNKELEQQRNEIEQKNKDLTDSINYAQRIQQAILPEFDEISRVLPDNFVLFMPRDIVSGDFYFFNEIKKEVNGVEKRFAIFAAADCTGHGVSGAMMSMMGSTILNEIVALNCIHKPSEILKLLNHRLQNDLKQGKTDSLSRDGMDIALCTLDMDTKEMWFSGALRPCYIMRNKELIEFKGNKFPIGGMLVEEERNYCEDFMQMQSNDRVYLSSDGYVSQFGGEKSKKFTTKRFKDVLMASQQHDMTEQKLELILELDDWMGDTAQVDDILVIGVRVH
ncbi:MAG: SpoIIE family protein phosphatase [Bacteroidia bacterium]|nr:SpoIIE family protein phosphatase [Bacteroidia bacterium]